MRSVYLQGNPEDSLTGIPESTVSGILPLSWKCWNEIHSAGGAVLCLQGSAAPESDRRKNSALALIGEYRARGPAFIHSLRGSFALALWDAREEKLFLATDHFGTRRVYYWHDGNRLAFAPSLKDLTESHKIERVIDPNSVYFYLNHSFIPAPFTIFKDIRRMEPGHLLEWDRGQLVLRKYWDMEYPENHALSEEDAAASVRDSLRESVHFAARRCRDGDSVGAFLSGGTDSSALVGLLSETHSTPVKAFSVGFDEEVYNEIRFARIAAKHFNSEAYEYFVRPDEALETVHRLGAAYDEPFGNSSAVPTLFCLRMARAAGVNVMFAGDGGDELYGGNERYTTERVFALYRQIPWPARTLMDRAVAIAPGFGPLRKAKNYIRKANLSPIDRFFAYQLYFRDHAAEYLSADFAASIDYDFPLDLPRRRYGEAKADAALNKLLYVDLKLAIADNDLFKVNRTADTQEIQVVYPYLDPKVAMASGAIPASLKVKSWQKRYIFKKAFGSFLPAEILGKKKHGFGLPTGEWLRRHAGFRDLARALLLEPRSVQRGYFQRPALERLLALHDVEASSYYGSQIWNLMMLELWHRNFADVSGCSAGLLNGKSKEPE